HTTLWRIAQLAGGRARAMRGKYGEAKSSGILGCDETGILIRGIRGLSGQVSAPGPEGVGA
ncbi:MAG: hypothetical protein M0T85_11025, partial [Dehalococcoidales bacterium]|nr:hypothetical protein [Dehalococcoidales bacterium]